MGVGFTPDTFSVVAPGVVQGPPQHQPCIPTSTISHKVKERYLVSHCHAQTKHTKHTQVARAEHLDKVHRSPDATSWDWYSV